MKNNKISLQAVVVLASTFLLVTIPWRQRIQLEGALAPNFTPQNLALQISNGSSGGVESNLLTYKSKPYSKLVFANHQRINSPVGSTGSFYSAQGTLPPLSFKVISLRPLKNGKTIAIIKLKKELPNLEGKLVGGKVFLAGRPESFMTKIYKGFGGWWAEPTAN